MTEHIGEALTYEVAGAVAVLRFDDGKANVLGFAAIEALHAGLDRASDEAGAVALIGREGKFSAGFDLAVMTGDDRAAARDLLEAGARLIVRMYLHPQPVVAGVTGHALAAGAIMLLGCDVRIGEPGPYKIGMNEVGIGMTLPRFAVELARDRLSRRHFHAATQQAHIYDPATAADAGFLDEVVGEGQAPDAAIARAAALAEGLHRGAFAGTREHVRGDNARAVLSGLESDVATFAVASS